MAGGTFGGYAAPDYYDSSLERETRESRDTFAVELAKEKP
jgi:hypothetical protein